MRFIFAQPNPGDLDGWSQVAPSLGKVGILDVPFGICCSSLAPAFQVGKAWWLVENFGPNLVQWLDHKPNPAWEETDGDHRFSFYFHAEACAPLVLNSGVDYLTCDTLICHRCLDGLLSAATAVLNREPYTGAFSDAQSFHNDHGLTETGHLLWDAIRAAGKSDLIFEQAILALVHNEAAAWQVLKDARDVFRSMLFEAYRLSRHLTEERHYVFVDATEAARFYLDGLLEIAANYEEPVAVVRIKETRRIVTVADVEGRRADCVLQSTQPAFEAIAEILKSLNGSVPNPDLIR